MTLYSLYGAITRFSWNNPNFFWNWTTIRKMFSRSRNLFPQKCFNNHNSRPINLKVVIIARESTRTQKLRFLCETRRNNHRKHLNRLTRQFMGLCLLRLVCDGRKSSFRIWHRHWNGQNDKWHHHWMASATKWRGENDLLLLFIQLLDYRRALYNSIVSL